MKTERSKTTIFSNQQYSLGVVAKLLARLCRLSVNNNLPFCFRPGVFISLAGYYVLLNPARGVYVFAHISD